MARSNGSMSVVATRLGAACLTAIGMSATGCQDGDDGGGSSCEEVPATPSQPKSVDVAEIMPTHVGQARALSPKGDGWIVVGTEEQGAFDEVSSTFIELRGVYCDLECRAVGDGGVIWRRNATDTAWEVEQDLGDDQLRLNAVASHLVVGDGGAVYARRFPAGHAWYPLDLETDRNLYAATAQWIVGEAGAVFVNVGKDSWEPLESGLSVDLVSVFESVTGMYAVGVDGTLIAGHLGSDEIEQLSAPPSPSFHLGGFSEMVTLRVYLLADDGGIYARGDGQWRLEHAGVAGPYVDVAVLPIETPYDEPSFMVAGLRPDGSVVQTTFNPARPGSPAHCPYEVGRPLIVEGRLLLPAVEVGGHLGIDPTLASLDEPMRETLAHRWCEMARGEYASIAAFARFIAQLEAVAAPDELIAQAQRAMRDEAKHATLCFGLASRYAGKRLRAGALPREADGDVSVDAMDAAVSAFREGCIGETISAFEAGVAALRATDPVVRRALAIISEDETRHAALSWSFVRWSLQQLGAPLYERLVRELDAMHAMHAMDTVPTSDAAEPSDADADADADAAEHSTLRAHGCLPADERRRCHHVAWTDVVLPTARVLLTRERACVPDACWS